MEESVQVLANTKTKGNIHMIMLEERERVRNRENERRVKIETGHRK